ncbi:hypothetical protein J6590_037636 [Homalodisca vitripennis]|nr:hypothetical protein J6590_037636 [Homalodisca vitripennis]
MVGCTRAYHKKGILMAKFPSILPFGSPARRGKRDEIIILDCIWNAKKKMLFALDVLFWRMQPLLSCDADFRMYWLRTKISELKKYDQPLPLGEGVYDVHLPSHCTLSTLPAVLADHNPSELSSHVTTHPTQRIAVVDTHPVKVLSQMAVPCNKPFNPSQNTSSCNAPWKTSLRGESKTSLLILSSGVLAPLL